MESNRSLEPHIEALNEFYGWIDSLPVEAIETALRGLKEYATVVFSERDIIAGRIKFE